MEPKIISLRGLADPHPLPQPKTIVALRQVAIARLKEGCDEVRPYFKPYPITQSDIRFSEQKPPTTVTFTIARDYPFSEDERRWLKVALEKKIGVPLALELNTVPFLPPLSIGSDGNLDESSSKALVVLKPFAEDGRVAHLVIMGPRTKRG